MSVRLLVPVLLLAAAVQAVPQKSSSKQDSPPPTPLAPEELVEALRAQLTAQDSERGKQCRKVVLADWRDVTNSTKRSAVKLVCLRCYKGRQRKYVFNNDNDKCFK